ncbi:unnamed protein product [Nippostrongylus brasiliensis]|uniref:Tudor-knot domain-containing protein n=1 Tax=Nippostrongylus brasiliensis TaxID=27835 RepID=A0A0N4XEC3_NIPBR|nr:unnamed protein product [Nippostrongylus brasiliensis]
MPEHREGEREVILESRSAFDDDKPRAEKSAGKRARTKGDEDSEVNFGKKKRTADREEIQEEPLPMNVTTEIRNGVRYLSPYWAVYRTRTKGRWIGRKMVEVFAEEFLSLNKLYPVGDRVADLAA